jgi:hypothetical protein
MNDLGSFMIPPHRTLRLHHLHCSEQNSQSACHDPRVAGNPLARVRDTRAVAAARMTGQVTTPPPT